MSVFDIKSDAFQRAVLKIQRRAEKQEFQEKLLKSFVPTIVMTELQNNQNQLIFGRRGVGKTHMLKVFLDEMVQQGHICSYVDCTSFGSALGSDGSPKSIGARFFSKFLHALANNLFEQLTLMEPPKAKEKADRCLDLLGRLSELANANLQGETFDYSKINEVLQTFTIEFGSNRCYVLIDEWAQIPPKAQPFFAEFLKRSLFASQIVTVKVSVVDYAYQLSTQYNGSTVGLEKSADIFSDVRMDIHFVWAENAQYVEDFFATLLYNHLALEVDLSVELPPPAKIAAIRNSLFTQDRAFSELCRASEGNARDFLVMFGQAYSDFRRQRDHERIGIPDIQRAAISWYREDKLANIATEAGLEGFLKYLIDEVISRKRARAFMVPVQAIQHPLLRRLFSARILHPLRVEWSHPDRPGERYSLVMIDYGTYASFKGTKNEPNESLFWEPTEQNTQLFDDLVPLKNDRRSIRRIVVTAETLDKYWKESAE